MPPQVLPSALSPALPPALPSAPMYFPMQSVLAPKAPKHLRSYLRLRSVLVLVLATAKKHAMQQHLALRLRAAAMLKAVLRCRVYLVALGWATVQRRLYTARQQCLLRRRWPASVAQHHPQRAVSWDTFQLSLYHSARKQLPLTRMWRPSQGPLDQAGSDGSSRPNSEELVERDRDLEKWIACKGQIPGTFVRPGTEQRGALSGEQRFVFGLCVPDQLTN